MDSSEYAKYFIDSTEILLNKLKTWLPEDASIKAAIIQFDTAKKVIGPRLLMAKFIEHVLPCKQLLWAKDAEFFNIVSEFGDVNMFHHLSAQNQLFVWKKIEAMVLLAAKALNIPHESLF